MSSAKSSVQKAMKLKGDVSEQFFYLYRDIVGCESWKGESVEVLRDEMGRLNKKIVEIAKEIEEISKTYQILDRAVDVAESDRQNKILERMRNGNHRLR